MAESKTQQTNFSVAAHGETYPVLSVEWPDKWPDGSDADEPITVLVVRGTIPRVGAGDKIAYVRGEIYRA